ncbi:MAG TPA: hypothetical protein PLV45_00855 [bacterium]|nr:hypothetical protein [bacterium]
MNRHILMSGILYGVMLVVVAGAGAAELNWTAAQYVLGSTGHIGARLSLASSVTGNYHLAISNENNGSVWYGKWEEPTWVITEQAVMLGGGAMAVGDICTAGDMPFMLIRTYDTYEDRYLYTLNRAGGSWSAPIRIDAAQYTYDHDFCLDSLNFHQVVYTRVTSWGLELMYATNRSGAWEQEQIEFYEGTGLPVELVAIDTDSMDRPHFIWYDTVAGDIKYAVRTSPHVFEIESVTTPVLCQWLDLVIMDGDIPYMGFKDAPSNYLIKERFKVGGSFYGGTVVSTSDTMYDVSLAIAAEEGILVSNLYYVYSTYHAGLQYAHYDSGWHSEPIDELPLNGVCLEHSAVWDGTRDAVGLSFKDQGDGSVYFALGYLPSNPTPTPSPTPDPAHTPTPTPDPGDTPTPEPTPTPPSLEDLWLYLGPDQDYRGGDYMAGYLRVENFGAARNTDIYILLEVYGLYYFGPAWTQSVNHYIMFMDDFDMQWIEYLPEFRLPDPLPAGGPFYFYAAAFEPDTLEASTLISNVAVSAFSFL